MLIASNEKIFRSILRRAVLNAQAIGKMIARMNINSSKEKETKSNKKTIGHIAYPRHNPTQWRAMCQDMIIPEDWSTDRKKT